MHYGLEKLWNKYRDITNAVWVRVIAVLWVAVHLAGRVVRAAVSRADVRNLCVNVTYISILNPLCVRVTYISLPNHMCVHV